MKIAVIGAGTMGRGIAIAFAQNEEHTVLLCDIDQNYVTQAMVQLKNELEKLTVKNIIKPELFESILQKVTPGLKEDAADCELVIEAIQENLEVKRDLFITLHTICKRGTIFATNTSSLSLESMNEGVERPIIGLHFFNPVPMMKLVEIVSTKRNSLEMIEKMKALIVSLGKIPVITKDHPGFIVNRILIPMINEAIGVLANNTATAGDIDTAMKLGANHPIGPLALGDLIGLDVCLAIMEVFYNQTKDIKYKPNDLLINMVANKKLGRKTGSGFFDYKK